MKALNAIQLRQMSELICEMEERITRIIGSKPTIKVFFNNGRQIKTADDTQIAAEGIIKEIAALLNLTYQDIMGKSRKRHITDGRCMVIELLYEIYPHYSLYQMGSLVGNIDHATVLHGRRKFKNLYGTDRQFTETFNALRKECVRMYPNAFSTGVQVS